MSQDFTTRRLEVQDEIEFERLLDHAKETLEQLSGKDQWTEMLESDPGITLMQAMTWNVLDLAWRHTHPLQDLLTPPLTEQDASEGIFGANFGPQRILTHSPVTADDYRRALLDLHTDDFASLSFSKKQLLLGDAILLKEPEGEKFTYWFNPATFDFTTQQPTDTSSQSEKMRVEGGYHLWYVCSFAMYETAKYDLALKQFIEANRNLGEKVRKIQHIPATGINPYISLELEDDCYEPGRVLADLLLVLNKVIYPRPGKWAARDFIHDGFDSEEIFQGPEMKRGWYSESLPERDYSKKITVDLRPVIQQIMKIEGVKAIRFFSMDKEKFVLTREIGPLSYPYFWDETDRVPFLCNEEYVNLFKKGQKISVQPEEVKKYLPGEDAIEPGSEQFILPYGKWRNPGRYYSISSMLPPCYNLQLTADEGDLPVHLHQYLLPFEQWLSNRLAMLANLPTLLSFKRKKDEGLYIWGHQWPFIDPETDQQAEFSDPVHSDYRAPLNEEISHISRDDEGELRLLSWLMSYFGRQRADRILDDHNNDYLKVMRGGLSEEAEIGYGGSRQRIGEISAPIKRIATRLGFGSVLFDDISTTPDTLLPFYLVEHWSLLPEQTSSQYFEPQAVIDVQNEDGGDPVKKIVLTLQDKLTLNPGVQIDLIFGADPASAKIITNLVITGVDAQKITLDTTQNRTLQVNWTLIQQHAADKTLHWRCSDMWLKEKSLPFELPVADGNEFWLPADPVSPLLTTGVKLGLFVQNAKKQGSPVISAADTEVEIIERDPLNARLKVTVTKGTMPTEVSPLIMWYPVTSLPERFSLAVSLVFNRETFFPVQATHDKEAVLAWVQEVVSEEMPLHLNTQIHWFNGLDFQAFGKVWSTWQGDGEPLGDLSYELLKWLSLGELPKATEGIGTMHVATNEELATYATPEGKWRPEDYQTLLDNEILIIP
ncbi:TPA: hypothetical protein QH957_002284 [Enterobacter bugandensis]|nr:hypothetical protein [Enterobacter bugandensis]